MLKWQQWIKNLSLALGLLVLLICIVQVEKKYNQQRCKRIQVSIIPIAAQPFIDEKAILTYLNAKAAFPLYNSPLRQINTKELEYIIKSHNFVQECSVYKSWQGSLKITILPRCILARVINNAPEPDCYIDTTGMIVPLSAAYTPRVLLIESKKKYKLNSNILATPAGQDLLNMLKIITEDPFWKAQITHISITQQNEWILSTQFSRHKIYFGQAENMLSKMKKLKLFYEVILPYKGWDAYKRINLKFDNQIVCE
jgi:cell division protein FtsQ